MKCIKSNKRGRENFAAGAYFYLNGNEIFYCAFEAEVIEELIKRVARA